MDLAHIFFKQQEFVLALGLSQARILALLSMIPLFNKQLVPRLVRAAAGLSIGMLVVPVLLPAVHQHAGEPLVFLLIFKEIFVGFTLGYLLAVPFWAFEAAGFLIDNQRGASIASTLNPLTGNDSSPLGVMFNQAYIVYFLMSGGFLLVLGVIYDSYRLWPVFGWLPPLGPDFASLMLVMLDRLMRLAMLYCAPVIVVMFLAELGLAFVSRFVPQLQVFFLAMPIKSALALLMLITYAATMFDLAGDSVAGMRNLIPTMTPLWPPAEGTR
jgi:type III secretion protein T